MTGQLHIEILLTEIFIQIAFWAAIVFAIIYMKNFRWRETITGRATTVLILAIAGTLLRVILILYGAPLETIKGHTVTISGFWQEFWEWISVICLGLAGLSIVALTFAVIQHIAAEKENANRLVCWIFRLGVHRHSEKQDVNA